MATIGLVGENKPKKRYIEIGVIYTGSKPKQNLAASHCSLGTSVESCAPDSTSRDPDLCAIVWTDQWWKFSASA